MRITKIMRELLTLGLILGGLVGATTGVMAMPSAVALAATSDDTSARTITLHKYTESATPSTATPTGTTADADNVPSDSDPIQGIQFTVQRVNQVAGKKLAGSDDSTYTVDSTFTALTVTTNSDGKAVANVGTGKTADGYYLVTEKASKLVAAAATPFIVHLPQTTKSASGSGNTLNYDVNVYPKNTLDDDAVGLNPEKFVQDESGESASVTSVMKGKYVEWNLVVTRPADIETTDDDGNTTYASELTVSDPMLTQNMTFLGFVEAYCLTPDGKKVGFDYSWYDLTHAKAESPIDDGDYKVAVIKLTDAGIKAFASQPAGTKMVFTIATTILPDTTGKIVNTFDTFYKGTATGKVVHEHSGTSKPLTDGATDPSKPTKPSAADTNAPIVYTGNVDIKKTDEDGQKLANATFTLYPTAADAKAGTNPVKDGIGKVIAATSGANGIAEFVGLKVDPQSQEQTYYAVETDAPVGYDVNGDVAEVTAKRDTDVDATVKDHDNLLPNLPLTGRTGRIMLYSLAGILIIVGGAGVVITKRRRKNN